jgi:hypothetical protein
VSARERVEAAIQRAGREVVGLDRLDQMLALIDAGFTAMAAELDALRGDSPAGREMAAPTRELPTGRFAHVYVTKTSDGGEHDPPLLATLDPDDLEDEIPWWVEGLGWYGPDSITGWLPARVVRDDEYGPAQALHRIAHQEFDRKTSPVDIVDELREVAAEALRRLDGEG